MTESAEHRIETAQLRRSPRYVVFFVLGGALGVLVALILTLAFDGTVDDSAAITYSTGQVFGFLALVGVTVGIALGGVVALIFDRVFSRRARDVRIDHERVEVSQPAETANSPESDN